MVKWNRMTITYNELNLNLLSDVYMQSGTVIFFLFFLRNRPLDILAEKTHTGIKI